jgi:tetratricopeptide (TPR) repeat protein
MKKNLFLLLLVLPFTRALSQINPDKQKAQELKEEAVRLMDNGDPDKAIDLLNTAQRLDPDNYTYLYETGYAWIIKKDYPKAIEAFRKTTRYPDVTDQCYQMLGNAYDYNGERNKAREAYAEGVKKFPSAGRLYMESGLLDQEDKNYDHAVLLWEKGIQVDPNYPSNYYRLAKLFAQTDERIWAALYGELFLNLERGTDRTQEMSRLLFNVYKKSITMPSDTSKSLKLDMTGNTINYDPKKEFKIPFRLVFTMYLITGLSPAVVDSTHKNEVTIALLNKARVLFIDIWFNQKKVDQQYPNVLLDFQRLLGEKGWLEAYNYWLLMKGDEQEFTKWRDSHSDTWDAFLTWFKDNPLRLDTGHLFIRTQYN